MNNFLNYLLPFLKFGAIFLSAFSGGLGLLVEFKEDGHITKWGKRALWGVIISFIIAATIQGVEIYRNKLASIAEEEKTQKMLLEISRGIYSIDASKLSFDLDAEIHANDTYFKNYNLRVLSVINKFQAGSNLKLPGGVFEIPTINEKGQKVKSTSFIITPGSVLYPSSNREKEIFNLIGQMAIDVSFYKTDSLINSLPAKGKNPNVSFSTKFIKPELEFNTYDTTITIRAKGLRSDLDDYAWRNHGGIESLLDFSNGLVVLSLSDRLIDNLTDDGMELSKSYSITCFSLNINDRKFSSCNLCKETRNWTTYYLKLPKDILQTHLDIHCSD